MICRLQGVEVGLSTFKNGDLLYYDKDSVEDNSNSMKVRTKLEYSGRGIEEEKITMKEEGVSEVEMGWRGYDRLHYTIILWEMKCNDKMSCMLTFTDYDRSEKILISHNFPAIESCDFITPEAPEIHSIFQMLCNKKQ